MSTATPPVDLRPDHLEIVRDTLRRHVPDRKVLAFGSRATWTAKEYSDLDLAILGNEPLPLGVTAALADDFSESDLPFKVDLVDWAGLDESFRDIVRRDQVTIQNPTKCSERLDAVDTWTETTIGDAFEINPSRTIKRGDIVPFIPMDTLPVHSRALGEFENREFTGSGARFQNGDTLIARITPCLENGKTVFVSELPQSVVAYGSTEYIVLTGREGISDGLFAYYLARDPAFRRYAVSRMEGTSGRQRVPSKAVEEYSIYLPSLVEQRTIAHILGTLDDKIELNRRMNETLEAMARAIFKDWFVDFGPTRAKIEGRAPYLPPETWDLFPATLDGEGKPVGWRIGPVTNYFDLTMGQSPPGSTYNDNGEGLPFFQGRTDFGFRYPENRKFCTAPTRIAEHDDTLVSVRAPVGDINMAWERCCIGRGVAALRHKSGSRSFTYYSAWAIQQEMEQYEHTGTVFGAINKKQFESLEAIEPTLEIVEAFESIVGPFDGRVRQVTSECRALVQLRDTLLPKLISGELRIAEAKDLLERIEGLSPVERTGT